MSTGTCETPKPLLDGEHDPREPPFFSPHDASRSYSSIASVVAGFCFAGIVLLVSLEQERPGQLDRVVGAMLTAFVGLVLSAFLMAIVAGQTRPSTRSFWLALWAGVSLATAALFALWAIAELIWVVFSDVNVAGSGEDLTGLVRYVFVVTSILVCAFVTAAAIDLRRIAIARAWPEPAEAAGAERAEAAETDAAETAGTERARSFRDEAIALLLRPSLAAETTALVLVQLGAWAAAQVLTPVLHITPETSIRRVAMFELGVLTVGVLSALWLSTLGRLAEGGAGGSQTAGGGTALLLSRLEGRSRRTLVRLTRLQRRRRTAGALLTYVLVAVPPSFASFLFSRLHG